LEKVKDTSFSLENRVLGSSLTFSSLSHPLCPGLHCDVALSQLFLIDPTFDPPSDR
jgi:hypothetical protein